MVSSFFSAAETAITSFGILKAKHKLDTDGQSASHIKVWLTHPGRVLTTILIYNTAINVLISAIVTDLAYQRFQNGAVSIATGITTLLVLIFGEVIPKSFAKAHYQKLAPIFLRVVVLSYYLIYPVIRILSGFADRLIHFASGGRLNTPAMTEEELEFIVNEGGRAGVIGDIKKSIIDGAFDFDETKVREIMTPRTDIQAFSINSPLSEMMKQAIETGYSRFPVYRNHVDHMVGMVLVKDLLAQTFSSKTPTENVTAKDIMRDVLFDPESKSIMDVFKDLQRTKNHMAIIIDEYGGTAGLVTMEDILEEIVGDIQDESDKEEEEILKLNESTYEISGSLNLEDFFEVFDIKITDELEREQDVDTIAGFITQTLGQLPKTGQKIELHGLHIEVRDVKNRRIQKIRVTKSKGEVKESGS